MPVSTKTAFRRDLAFESVEDLERELASLRAANHAGTLRASGNWTPGQTLGHLAKWIGFYYDGFPFRASPIIRTLGRLLKKRIINAPFKPGLKFTPKSGSVGDDPEYAFEDGYDRLIAQLDRLRAGESMACDTPLVGPVTHDEAVRIHLNHAALHLSFLHPGGAPRLDDRGS